MIGTKLAHYEITSHIGSGGMGDVYRGRDTQLKRDVALKVLPPSVAGDVDRMARFQREAELLASLNHPNIASIYGLASAGSTQALVMELVEGDSPKGPLSWDDAWKIAQQIAAALEYAHDRGIIHRDLKPANILVTRDGVVKLLDFGLAKALTDPNGVYADPDNSPTLTMGATHVGTILGTAAYMSPEQAKGKSVDKRSDIWAFGVVLWELLIGERLFKGEDAADTTAHVLTQEVEIAKAPVVAQRLLDACLQKDPKLRLRDIGDAKRLIASEQLDGMTPIAPARGDRWGWIAAAVMAAALGVGLWAPWRKTPSADEVRFQIQPPSDGDINEPAVSPDGRRIAFIQNRGTKLWVRELNSLEAKVIPLADPITTAFGAPIWSPDSKWIAYPSNDYTLKKSVSTAGPPVTLCDLPTFGGGTWNKDGVILLGTPSGEIKRVADSGGPVMPVTTLDKTRQDVDHLLPQFLPDGRFLYWVRASKEASGFYLASLDDPKGKRILPAPNVDENRDGNFSYAPPASRGKPGHLMYIQDGVLMSQPVDPASLALIGGAFPIVDAGNFSTSQNAIVYRPRRSSDRQLSNLHWVDREGKPVPGLQANLEATDLALSADGKRAAVATRDSGSNDIWIFDMAGMRSRFTFEASDDIFMAWSPDGQWLAYATGRGRAHDRIVKRNTITFGAPETLVTGGADLAVTGWSPDGRYLLYSDIGQRRDIWLLDLQTKNAKPVPFIQTPADEWESKFSPDGKWIAYASDELRRREVFVTSVPPGSKYQVSTDGGRLPLWRADGGELFYRSPDGQIMSVKIQTAPRLVASTPQPLFRADWTAGGPGYIYAVSPDGNRFLVLTQGEEQRHALPYNVVLNWQPNAAPRN